jgi:CheY-like chemotaxis protein
MTTLRVLLIDDESDLRKAYAWYLRNEGYIVDEAETLSQALDLVERKTYHVALIDIMLSKNAANRDGFKVVAKLRELNEGTARIVLSQQDNPQLAADAVPKYGASGYLAKPTIRNMGMERLVTEIKTAANQNKLIPFGLRPFGKEFEFRSAISYLSSVQQIIVDQCLHSFRLTKGYSALEKFLEEFLTPLAPLLPRKGIDGFIMTRERPFFFLTGEFWSKAEGTAVQLIACRTQFRANLLSEEFSLNDAKLNRDALQAEISTPDAEICGLVFHYPGRNRNEYVDRLPESTGAKPGLPMV